MTPAPTSKPDDGTPVPFDPFGLPPFTGEMSEGQRGPQGMHNDVRRGHPPHVRCRSAVQGPSESRKHPADV